MEIKDPNTGQIKTSFIVLSGVGILGLLFFLGRSGGGASSPSVTSGGQSSDITDQLGSLSDAVANLAGRTNTGTGTPTPTPTPTPSPSPTPTSNGGFTNPPSPVTNQAAFQTWLQQALAAAGVQPRTNPTNPASPVALPNNSAIVNAPGGIVPPSLNGVIGNGDFGAYLNFINQYTGIPNAPAPQNPLPGDTTSLAQKLQKLLADSLSGNVQSLRSDINSLTGQNPAGSNSGPLETINTGTALPSVPTAPTSLYDTSISTQVQSYQQAIAGLPTSTQDSLAYYTNLRSQLLSQYQTATIQPIS